LEKAKRFALDLYEDLYLQVKSGGSIKTKTFRQVFDEWSQFVGTIGPTRQGGSWDSTIERVRTYALPFFGPKKIHAISSCDFGEFWTWRKSHCSKRPPTNDTLKRERTCLLPVFKFAVARGYISEVPNSEPPKTTLKRRPTFTATEWKTLYTKA